MDSTIATNEDWRDTWRGHYAGGQPGTVGDVAIAQQQQGQIIPLPQQLLQLQQQSCGGSISAPSLVTNPTTIAPSQAHFVRGTPAYSTTAYPPMRTKGSKLSAKFASPIGGKPKVTPGRLFVRIPNATAGGGDNNLNFQLGEFSIGLQFTEIERCIVEKARKKLERKKGGVKASVYEFDEQMQQRDDMETGSIATIKRQMEMEQRLQVRNRESRYWPEECSTCCLFDILSGLIFIHVLH